MAKNKQKRSPICSFYIDEAGDGNIFSGKRNKIIIGQDGCSVYFMLGFLEIGNPESLANELKELRQDLLDDPYFSDIPSMQLEANKTALAFHAKDDCPEVRREVFRLLKSREDLKFYAVVKDKRETLKTIRKKEKKEKAYRYKPNELYDLLVQKLFTNQLDRADQYEIIFAKRGKSNRTEALKKALDAAKNNSAVKVKTASLLNVDTVVSAEHGALQAVDYYLWTLQRLYEKKEERYFNYLWPHFRLVIDMDGPKGKVYFHQKRPLNVASLNSTIEFENT